MSDLKMIILPTSNFLTEHMRVLVMTCSPVHVNPIFHSSCNASRRALSVTRQELPGAPPKTVSSGLGRPASPKL